MVSFVVWQLLNGALAQPMCYLLAVTGLRDKVVLVTGASGGLEKRSL
jgi:hypothetical protein